MPFTTTRTHSKIPLQQLAFPWLLFLVTSSLFAAVRAHAAAAADFNAGGLFDRRFSAGLARWYIPDDLPDIWVQDHEYPPLSHAEAYGHYVEGPDSIHFYDSHWIRFFYQWVYQMKSSPLRVHSPEAADFIFVPVCLGSWCGARPTNPLYFRSHTYKWTHSPVDRKSYFFQHAQELLPWLGKKPHVMVFNGALPGDLLRSAAVNFTFIGLEAAPEMDKGRFLTAPYPSHEHHDIFNPMPPLESVIKKKEKLAVGVYVVRRAMSDGNANTRTVLHASCTAHPDACTHITWDLAHNMSHKASAYSNYTRHWYCLQPPGDWVLRGAFYDCVVAGGIPLVFNSKYPQYVAYSDVIDYTKIIRQAPATDEGKQQFTDYLAVLKEQHATGNSTSELEAWHKLGRIYEYALNPDHYLIKWSDRSKQDARDDAFTFSMKALLRGLCRQPLLKNSTKCQ